jgi:two-component system, cell cycle sensor histidine kinase and response regulator CckA
VLQGTRGSRLVTRSPSRAVAYSVASVLVVVALLIRVAANPLAGPAIPYSQFFPAILIASLYGGLGPGMFSVALSAFTANVWFSRPVSLFTTPSLADLQPLMLFVLIGVSIVSLTAAMRRAERGLRREADRWRTTLASIGDGVIVTDPRGHVRFLNAIAERLTGWDTAAAVDRPLDEIFVIANEETLEPVDSPVARVLRDGAIVGLANHTSLKSRDGQWTPIADCGAPIRGTTDQLDGVVLVFRDMTAERRLQRERDAAEERMRFALDAARVGVWEGDFKTGTIRWSGILETLHGLPVESFGGTFSAFLDRIHPNDHQMVRDTIERATGEHGNSTLEYRTLWPDGTLHWIRGSGRIFYDDAGTPLRAAGVGFDVTDMRALAEQYRQSQKMEAIGQLAGGVAHDFNNLLTTIHGYCGLLAEQFDAGSSQAEDLGEIRRAAERATALTHQLLAFSRRQRLETRILDLADSLRGIEPMLRRLIREDIELVIRSPGDIGHVKADPGQIEQVVLNLAINARDAMPQGGSLIIELADVVLDESYVRQHPGAASGPHVMLAVSDTGVGMDAATLSRIFEPFFTTKEIGKGTGLGLATVFGIAKQSGGNIWVYSEPGRGTAFKVYLPRVDGPVTQPVTHASPGAIGGSETVLLLEDEAPVRELVGRVLERYGYRVIAAATPNDAIALSAQEGGPIQLLISDVVLPQMGGIALAAQLRGTRPEMRILFMSGYTDSAIVHSGVLSQETPFLQKPFTPEALARKVREALT